MKTILSFLLGCSMAIPVFTQDLIVTFTATGETSGIDSVTALNMRTNISITIPGDSSLILKFTTGIPTTSAPDSRMVVSPNPFPGDSRVVLGLSRCQKVCLTVYNQMGQPVARTGKPFEPGEHEFGLSVKENGIYTVVVETADGLLSSKAVCLDAAGSENSLRYIGGMSGSLTKAGQQPVTNTPSGYELEYTTRDVIHYTCQSSVMTTIFTDTPAESVNYEVAFVSCTDPDGRNYKTVKIGGQTWMAENLAYLPSVSPSSFGSDSSPLYYVYGYEGSDATAAKETSNFIPYGVLYNWAAALMACPDGWHLASDDEWFVLRNFLVPTAGKMIKSTSGWYLGTNGDNSSGFNAVPGGVRVSSDGCFNGLGWVACFWSSTEHDWCDAWSWLLTNYFGDYMGRSNAPRSNGESVRCLKNEFAP